MDAGVVWCEVVVEEGLTYSSEICNQDIQRTGTGGKSVSTLVVSTEFSVKGELWTRTIVLRQILQQFSVLSLILGWGDRIILDIFNFSILVKLNSYQVDVADMRPQTSH